MFLCRHNQLRVVNPIVSLPVVALPDFMIGNFTPCEVNKLQNQGRPVIMQTQMDHSMLLRLIHHLHNVNFDVDANSTRKQGLMFLKGQTTTGFHFLGIGIFRVA